MAKSIHLTAFSRDVPSALSVLQLADDPLPEPGQGQVLVEIYLRPINPTDLLLSSGAYGRDFPLPRVPGSEGERPNC